MWNNGWINEIEWCNGTEYISSSRVEDIVFICNATFYFYSFTFRENYYLLHYID